MSNAGAISAQGSKLYIASGTSGAKNITSLSKAFNAEVGSTAHGLTAGDRVTFATVGGMTEINGITATVLSAAANTFVVNVDSRAFTTYTSGGTATPIAWTQIKELKDFSPSGASASSQDVTDLDSTAREFRPGLPDNGDFSFDINYKDTDPGQAALLAAFAALATKPFKLVDPTATAFTFDAFVTKFPTVPKGGVDKVLEGSVTLKITGAVTVV